MAATDVASLSAVPFPYCSVRSEGGRDDEATELSMRNALARYVVSVHEDQLDEHVIAYGNASDFAYSGAGGTNWQSKIADLEWGPISIRLMALGYIQKSQRSRSVRDTNTYWSLTPYGEASVIQLLAVQTGEGGADPSRQSAEGDSPIA